MEENPYSATANSAHGREDGPAKRKTVKSVDPVQMGKLMGIFQLIVSVVIFVPFFLLAAMFGKDTGMGVAFILTIPIIYGLAGFIGGIIAAFVYNVCAKIVGGIEVEVE
jgi:hypothetical protein